MSAETAKAIKEKRNRLHMTQKELADAIGLPKFGDRTIRRWENDESCLYTKGSVCKADKL